MEKNRQIVLASRPQGVPKSSDFRVVQQSVPKVRDGQLLVQVDYVSVDPYLRGLMRDVRSYAEPIGVEQVIPGRAAGTVLDSRHPSFQIGDVVTGTFGWQDYAVSDGRDTYKVETSLAPMSAFLGILGMPGMTAYFGLLDVGQPKEGESIFVSAAAGAVGSAVCQIARIKGCRVAGSAGTPEKVDYLLSDLAVDAAFNYKETNDYAAKLREVCPNGIDVYFDNVGGPLTDAAFTQLNNRARIVVCGQIEQYNKEEAVGPRLLWHLIVKRARAEGFLVFEYAGRYREGISQMAQWLREGKLKYRETITDGLENAAEAFIGLFYGENIGKQLVRVRAE
jgi:NADPH-dependent curcumin reductase CurA